jgi:hypothetical protein
MKLPSMKLLAGALSLAFVAAPTQVSASHSWGGYHWARTTTSFTLKLGDNLSAGWKSYLGTTSTDWTVSSVLNTTIVPGRTTPRQCRATSGQVEVCNERYGNNGWLGIASIWLSGSHIVQGTTKLNDSYFNTAKYNAPAWKNLVMCQEVGHTFGLAHQDENFNNANLNTCMDYTSLPESNQHPNSHDYQMLESIYSHLDTTTTVASTAQSAAEMPRHVAEHDADHPSGWGKLVSSSKNGLLETYVLDFGGGYKIVRHVIWVEGRERGRE